MLATVQLRELLDIYDVLLGVPDPAATHPTLVLTPQQYERKHELETQLLSELEVLTPNLPDLGGDPAAVVTAVKRAAASERIPQIYDWVAATADQTEMKLFLAAEGGPDGGFDDLVASAQIGIDGAAKMEMARNFWDEMGNGNLTQVHTDLHRLTTRTLDLQHRPPLTRRALQRACLGGLLASNHSLQPEMLGALGMIELQAGPRCRKVLDGMRRLGMPEQAQRFYAVHADVDPRHGADWATNVIHVTAARRPAWSQRMLVGAWWRKRINDAFLTELHADLAGQRQNAA